jgi:RNA polymerase sigma factor (sigma-70 family)
MQSTDLHLYAQWRRQRNAAAFNELARRHAAMVFGTCQRILRSADDAEEVAQECFETLATTAQGPDQNLGGWLHALATRRALNRLKSEARRREREQAFAETHPTRAEVHWDDIYPLVDEAITGLPEKLREPLIRNFFEGQTHEAIAAELGISRGAVTYRITQGVERIRKHLKHRGVVAGATALTAMLTENLASAETPATLTDAIARMALAGPPPVLVPPAAAVSGVALAWKLGSAFVGAVVALGAVVGAWHFNNPDSGGEPLPPVAFDTLIVGPESPIPVSGAEAEVAVSPVANPENTVFRSAFVGRVLDASGTPASGATVTLERVFRPFLMSTTTGTDPLPPFKTTVTADGHGKFAFTQAPFAGNSSFYNGAHLFTMTASLDGTGAYGESRTLPTAAPRVYTELTLLPLNRIDGHVLDATGNPFSGASMLVWRLDEQAGSYSGDPVSGMVPVWHENGSFSLDGLIPGRYFIRASAEGHASGDIEAYSGQSGVRIQLPAPCRIAGTVIEQRSGRALPGVRLIAWARPEQVHTATSDEQGRFAFDALMPAPYYVRLSMGDQPLGEPLSRLIDLATEGTVGDLVIEAYQGGEVTGMVRDAETGAPIPHGMVQAFIESRRNFEEGSLVWRTRADAVGRYRFEGLPTGDFTFIAEDAGADPVFQNVFPGRRYDDVDLLIDPGVRITGHVIDAEGKPVKGAWVFADGNGKWYADNGCTDETGHFELRWKEKKRTIQSIRLQAMSDSAISPATAPIELAPEGIEGVELCLEPAGFLEGEVRHADGSPAMDAQVVARPNASDLAVLGYHGEPRGNASGHNGVLDARVTASGRFILGPLPLGAYTLSAFPKPATIPFSDPTDPTPVASADTGLPAHALSRQVTVQERADFIVFELPRELDALPDVRGVVSIAGKPVQGAQVSLGYDGVGENPTWTRTDANGEFLFKDVRPGAAVLYGACTLPGKEAANQRSINSRKIEVLDSTETIANIQLGTGTGIVEGVVTINGEPRAGANVMVSMGDDENVHGTTGPDGTYIAEFVAEGPIRVVAAKNSKRGEGTWNRHYTGNLSPGERLRVDFEIGSGQLEGMVTNLAEGDLANVVLATGEWNNVPTLKELGTLDTPGIIAGQMQCEADGRFAFDDLAAGTYTVMLGALIADVESETFDESSYRAALAHVEIAEGKVTEVTVALPEVDP